MPEQYSDDGVNGASSSDAAEIRVPPDQDRRDAAQDHANAENAAQISKLNRKVFFALVASAFGPAITVIGLVLAGLQWKSGEGQLEAARGQLKVMQAQLQDARDGAAQARKDTDAVIAAAKGQAQSMKTLAEANKTMADAAKLSAQNSERIAKSSERNIVATRDSVRLDQRGWIGITAVDVEYTADKKTGQMISVTNTGKTPAIDVVSHSMMRRVPLGSPMPSWMEFPLTILESRQVVMPNQVIKLPVFSDVPMNAAMLEDVRLHRSVIFLRCRITYKDIFGERHETTYCGIVQDDLKSIAFCSSGNAAN